MSLATLKGKVEMLIEKSGNYKWLQDVFAKGADIRFENAEMTYFPDDLDFSNLKVMDNMFRDCKNLVLMPKIDIKNVTDLSYCWRGCSNLKVLTLCNTENVTTITEMITGCSALETISELNAKSITRFGSSWQTGCSALKNISFVPETIKVSIAILSPVLSDGTNGTFNSIQSIFDGLAPVETAQTLTLNANVKILQSQVDSANAKGWTVAGGTIVSEEEYYG